MTENEKDDATLIQKLSSGYGDLTLVRALIQAIPWAGGSLDTLMGSSGQRYREKRIESLIKHLSDEIQKIGNKSLSSINDSEELYDMMLLALEQSTRTRSEEKKKRFAKIIAHQIISPIDWDVADTIMRLISQLSEPHIELLQFALNAPVCNGSFDGLKVIAFSNFKKTVDDEIQPILIMSGFQNQEESLIRLLCMELVSMGLLKDEGVGRFGTGAMTYFVATGVAKKLFETIR
ncbi:hypothetical protein [Halobacteriovorax marinus]|uniref:hypothetical protein n=1 Tax=Halobacteriovorax marinus TaxID=97084 RepID=UPI003A8F75BD